MSTTYTKPPGLEDWEPIRTTRDLVKRLEKDKWLQDEIRKDPAKAIAQIAGPPLETDVWIYRLVVLSLGLTVIMVVVGAIFLTGMSPKARGVPEVLISLGSAAIGALAGLLAPSPGKKAY
jgi:hypothetical protein